MGIMSTSQPGATGNRAAARVACSLLLLAAGCAGIESIELTGRQGEAWDRFHDCQRETGARVTLKQIEPGGRFVYSGSRYELNRMKACLDARRSGSGGL